MQKNCFHRIKRTTSLPLDWKYRTYCSLNMSKPSWSRCLNVLKIDGKKETLVTLLLQSLNEIYVTRCVIWWHLYNLKTWKKIYGRVLLSVRLQAWAFNFTNSNTTPWVFFTFFKLRKWYQIEQSITYFAK